MPEEINRLVTDRLSDLLFATSPDAVAHLGNEGIHPDRIHLVGNPMIDTLLANLDRFDAAAARAEHGLDGRYVVATLHRPANVDDPADAAALVKACTRSPTRPRSCSRCTRAAGRGCRRAGLFDHPRIRVIDPLGYVEFIGLVRGRHVVVTDSGGVQEETTVLGVPCLTLRPNTERPVTITHGTNQLVTRERLAERGRATRWPPAARRPGRCPPLWDGQAGPRIARVIAQFLNVQVAFSA